MASLLLTPGTRVGRYEVVAHLASGGMGEVYRARDVELGRDVALKILAGDRAGDPASIERFRREARHAAHLSHKNIVSVYDWGQDGATWFMALELVEGIDLQRYIIAKGRVRPAKAWYLVIQAARALDHAFRHGVTHRDIKPSNFLMLRRGRKVRVKLTDFGLARTADDEACRVTRDGTTVGTIDYIAPEQARDSALADVRSDIYSLGCTLYHLLAGQPPFHGGGLAERLLKHIQDEPPDVRRFNPDVSEKLWAVLQRMLAKRPDERYQTPAELIEALLGLGIIPETNPPSGGADGADVGPGSSGEVPVAPGGPGSPLPTCAIDAFATETPVVSDQLRRAAATQFERAREILSDGGRDKRHAYDLLLSCCLLDPANVTYRRELRRVAPKVSRPEKAAAARDRFEAARQAREYRKVLEQGEVVLTHAPGDLMAHQGMAEAAAALGLHQLQLWLLEQAQEQAPDDPEPLRWLARACEQQKDVARAIAAWQSLRKFRPTDPEPLRKLDVLLRLLARAYERQNNGAQAIAVWQALLKLRPDDAEATRQLSALAQHRA
jgi:hypothetical protein